MKASKTKHYKRILRKITSLGMLVEIVERRFVPHLIIARTKDEQTSFGYINPVKLLNVLRSHI